MDGEFNKIFSILNEKKRKIEHDIMFFDSFASVYW
jgi:hypothetical protein